MKHFRIVLIMGVALPTLLLAWGWYASAAKESAALRRAREAEVIHTADAVRGAVDESLEELRQRESKRPFYLYNFYYSPPDALAINDPVLVSPLASRPDDPRLLGYFNVEPGGVVTTPHVSTRLAAPPFVHSLLSTLEGEGFAQLRSEVGEPADNVIAESNEYVAQQALDIRSANLGDPLANARIAAQGRGHNPIARAVVDEEPMAWRGLGGHFLLSRRVRDARAQVLQGAMLNHAYVIDEWLPRIVERHADAAVTLIAPGGRASCAVRRPVSRLLPLADLCFAGLPERGGGRSWQLGALLGLISIVFAGVYVVHRGSRRAEELAAQQSRFVSTVTHELRTPLTTMRMHAEMLRDGLVSSERQVRVHRELAEESARLALLVENVLELSRLEHTRSPLERRSADLSDCIARAAEAQRPALEEAGLELALDLPAECLARIDVLAVERLLVNLLDNAAKYAADAEPATVEVSLRCEKNVPVLVVRDHGSGIASRLRERVFERFHRSTESEHVQGTGIGLSLVRDIARAHHGEAEVLPTATGCAIRVTLGS